MSENTEFIIRISIQKDTKLGEVVYLVGDNPLMGNWELEQGIRMRWEEGNFWKARIRSSYLKNLEYKYCVVHHTEDGSRELTWETSDNKSIMLEPKARITIATIRDEWEKKSQDALLYLNL